MLALVILSLPGRHGETAPFPLCETHGILFQYPGGTNTQVHHIDMVTGDDSQPSGSPIANRTINAIGYNVKDQFVYGWDHTQETLVRIHNDHTAENLSISGYSHVGGHQIIIGDVDDKGHYWFINSSNDNWYQVDLTAATPTLITSGSAAGPTGTAGADWAWVTGTDNLYRTMDDGAGPNTVTLWAFNRTSKTWSSLGVLSGITGTSRTIGANYADADGFLYSSSNSTGNIWRTNVSTQDTALFSTGPSSGSNDGARCAQAIIPIDFGDAPSSYGTLLADDGPRHSVPGFNSTTNTAPLMLGTKIDIETDGFPGANATGDDDDDIDDERGVTHIVATPSTPTTLAIPATVTNNNSSDATLAGWIDLDSDGTFEPGERVTATIPASSGTAVYELTFPSTTFTTNTYARFRMFSGTVADPQPISSASAGEVEDVLVQVGSYTVNKIADPSEGTTVKSGQTVTYTLTIQNTGTTDLINLKIDDDLTDVLDDAELIGSPSVSPASAGTASVSGNTLEFAGDIANGQTVTVTYAVKVEFLGSLANSNLDNTILAAHSNCHPTVSGGTASTDDPDCNTSHPVLGLAATGMNMVVVLGAAGSLIALSAFLLWLNSPRRSTKTTASR
ncbi:MAG: DUF6923 family protein [Candidatus Saccharimonadales bacterium]